MQPRVSCKGPREIGGSPAANERDGAELLKRVATEKQDEADGTTDQRDRTGKIRRRYPARAAWAAWRARCAGSRQDDAAARQEDAEADRSGSHGLRRLASAAHGVKAAQRVFGLHPRDIIDHHRSTRKRSKAGWKPMTATYTRRTILRSAASGGA